MLFRSDTVPLPEGGFAGKISFNPGETVKLYYSKNTIKSDSFNIRPIEKDTVVAKIFCSTRPQKIRKIKPWKNGFGYSISSILKLKTLPTGIYLFDEKVPLIVKAKGTQSKILIVIPTNEFAANNMAGGKSLHEAKKSKRPANVVSFFRPENLSDYQNLIPFFEFLKADTSMHVGFIAEKDLENSTVFNGVRLVIIAGNCSHWTRRARSNFDRFIDKGGNTLVLSKEFMKWQVRYRQKGTQLICHKRKATDLIQDPYLKTTTWDDPSLKYPRPAHIEKSEFDLSSFSQFTGLDSVDEVKNIQFKVRVELSNPLVAALEVRNLNEKFSEKFIYAFGELAQNCHPFVVLKRKTNSGFYVQSSYTDILHLNGKIDREVFNFLLRNFSREKN